MEGLRGLVKRLTHMEEQAARRTPIAQRRTEQAAFFNEVAHRLAVFTNDPGKFLNKTARISGPWRECFVSLGALAAGGFITDLAQRDAAMEMLRSWHDAT